LSETAKAFAGITSDVTFVGHGHKFQIWEPNRFQAHLEEAKHRVRDLRRQYAYGAAVLDLQTPRSHGAGE
jgi:MraZ protein